MKRKQTINESMGLRAEKRKRNRRRLRNILAIVKILLILGVFASAVVFTAVSPLFDLKEIKVRGVQHYEGKVLTDISGIVTGINGFRQKNSKLPEMLLLRYGDSERAISSKCPYIKNVKVWFSVPSTVFIDVTERKPAFLVKKYGTSLLIDEDGYVLEAFKENRKVNVPEIFGLVFDTFAPGQQLPEKNKSIIDRARMLFDTIARNDKSGGNFTKLIDRVFAGDTSNIRISLDKRVIVNFGNLEDLNYKISTAKTIFVKNIKEKDRGTLDTTGKNPVFSPETEKTPEQ